MSRNGAGTFTTPNTFVAGTTITAAAFNQNFSDIASELTNSVAADGQTSMTGPLKASNGAVAAPSHSFASDTDTGMYRSADGEVSIAGNGNRLITISSAGISAASGTFLVSGSPLVPPGVIADFAGANEPAGWLFCNGQAVSRTTYTDLFATIGTAYGPGNGVDTFNLPDLRGRVSAGVDNMGGIGAAGRLTGLALTGTQGSQDHNITAGEMPSHTHSVSGTTGGQSQDHTHQYDKTTGTATAVVAAGGTFATTTSTQNTGGTSQDHTHSFSATSGSTGSGTAMNIVQPTLGLNKIIKW